MSYTLVSHVLCPYVQRVAIVLREKGIPFERVDIDLANKPEWFLRVSPLGKTPVLLVDGQAIFESAVVCEYLEDVHGPALHPATPLRRAQHRAWMEFASSTLNDIGALYNAPGEAALENRARVLRGRLEQVDQALGKGPFFDGPGFSMVDAAFGPVFRYFDVLDTVPGFAFFDGLPRLTAWRAALAGRASVREAVSLDYPQLLREFLLRRGSALSERMSSLSSAE